MDNVSNRVGLFRKKECNFRTLRMTKAPTYLGMSFTMRMSQVGEAKKQWTTGSQQEWQKNS